MGMAFTEIPISKPRKPKRILHFSDGVLEEYSSEDEEETDQKPVNKTVADPKDMSWAPYFWYLALTVGSKTLAVCDYLGENLAYFFGITSPKYQYEIEEYQRMLQEEDDEKERLEDEVKSGWVTTPLQSSDSVTDFLPKTTVQSVEKIHVEPSSLSLNLSPPIVSFPNSPSLSNEKQWDRY